MEPHRTYTNHTKRYLVVAVELQAPCAILSIRTDPDGAAALQALELFVDNVSLQHF